LAVLDCETFLHFATALSGFPRKLPADVLSDLEDKMPLRLSLPKFRKPTQVADVDTLDEEEISEEFTEEITEDPKTNRRKRIIRIAAIAITALAAGQVAQTINRDGSASAAVASAKHGAAGKSEVAAVAKAPVIAAVPAKAAVTPPPAKAAVTPVSLPKTVSPPAPAPVATAAVATAPKPPAPATILPLATPVSASPETVEPLVPTPMQTPLPAPVVAAAPCNDVLDLATKPGAILGLTLTAACHENQRVVLRHAGLAITGQTNATGSLRLTLPALAADGAVEVLFADGKRLQAATPVPELAALHRFGVQWGADDAFALHGLENGADFAEAGDISAAQPGHAPTPGQVVTGGYLLSLGDASVAYPLLAQVYTYPVAPDAVAEVAIEAAVTPRTCGREMLGQTISSTAGKTSLTDLTLTMPACDAAGGYLVLNNLFPDTKIAASN
jgi:hypothetical protein